MEEFGSADRTRTHSPLVNSRMLCLLLVTYIEISSKFERGNIDPSADFRSSSIAGRIHLLSEGTGVMDVVTAVITAEGE